MTLRLNREIFQRTTPEFVFTFTKAGSPFNLTGATVKFIGKTDLDDTTPLWDRTCTIDAPETGGVARVKLTAAQTALEGLAICDVEITEASTDELLPVQISLSIKKRARRS